MDRLVIASMRKSAGKTSLVVGMGEALGKRVGYMKPIGDRLLYKKKRLWDYDTALMTGVFDLKENPENMGIGFDHSKLKYMYDENGMKKKVLDDLAAIEKDKDVVFVESGMDIHYGSSVRLDAISLAKYTSGKLIVVVSGEENAMLDDITFLKKYVDMSGVNFAGVVANKVQNMDEFETTHLREITDMGVPVLGTIPYEERLHRFSVSYIAEQLFAKVITGETDLKHVVKTIFIGAMSANAALHHPLFKKEDKLIITSGDRSDMILASLETNSVCIVLTNNIIPPSNIISKAAERNVPLLLVPFDTLETAKKIEAMEPLLTKEDSERIGLLGKLVKERVKLNQITGA
jgi:BioD-like phosphotransacetylase family protein